MKTAHKKIAKILWTVKFDDLLYKFKTASISWDQNSN